MGRAGFATINAPDVIRHVDVVEGQYYGVILRAAEEELPITPCDQTRHRKRLVSLSYDDRQSCGGQSEAERLSGAP
jgi:hypothetical protein